MRRIAVVLSLVVGLWLSFVLLCVGAENPVGYYVISVPVNGTRTISCSVWYPARPGSIHIVYELDRITREGGAFTDARPDTSLGARPLVLVSHGYSGCSVASAYLCERLAAAGFVVVAPDHTDDLKACSLIPGYLKKPFSGFLILANAMDLGDSFASGDYDLEDYRYRFTEIAATIDFIKNKDKDPRSPLYSLIDEDHIGAVGHSLGGFSVMVAAGARDIGVNIPIDAVVSLSGPGGEVFSCDDMGRIAIPVMLMYGENERNKRRKGAGLLSQYRCLTGPKFLMGLVGGDHVAFSEGLFFDRYLNDNQKEEARMRHDLIGRYVTAFFEFFLMGRHEAKAILQQSDPGLDPYYFSDRM